MQTDGICRSGDDFRLCPWLLILGMDLVPLKIYAIRRRRRAIIR